MVATSLTRRLFWPLLLLLSRIGNGSAILDRSSQARCTDKPDRLSLADPPYEDYFYSDCNSASQVVVTTPLKTSDLTLIGPRLLVAWPAGNSGVVAFFAPKNGKNGTLSLELVPESPKESIIQPIYVADTRPTSGHNPMVGITGVMKLNSSALLDLAILGSVRTIRDFTEGPSILVPEIQDAINFDKYDGNGAILSRLWLDNVTTTDFSFKPTGKTPAVTVKGQKVSFEAGEYRFRASFNYPQLKSLDVSAVLNPASQDLITQQPDRTKSLSFFSYTDKLLAGGWRFLTYFGRDSMISLLLLQPVLSTGKGGAIEAVISAVLERIDHHSGAVCHEETIGDYATYLNEMNGIYSTKPSCSYIMIDSDYYFPIVMNNYFVLTKEGRERSKDFFNQKAVLDFGNKGLSYTTLAFKTANRIMTHAAHFAGQGNQTKQNLRHLEPDQIVGEWRDSTYGIGGGRIPFDVNTGLVPAALRAIGSLARAGYFKERPAWKHQADAYAQVWEDHTLKFFAVTVPRKEAKSLVRKYVKESGFKGPDQTDSITDDVTYHGLALNGNNNQEIVKVMNTDVAFRLFLLNTTNDEQLTSLLTSTSRQILTRFPAGLSTDVGMLVANPAYGGAPVYAKNFTRADYHGTVVWSWPLAMMAKGLEQQLGRCTPSNHVPAFCGNKAVYGLVTKAYNHLWDLIDQNTKLLSTEVWSWEYDVGKGEFKEVDLGTLSSTESDIRQLWSLTFLAVKRNEAFR